MARSLFDPSEVDPLSVDLFRVAAVGTGIWALALAVTGVVALTVGAPGRLVATCAAGMVLGFVGMAWARRHPNT